MKQLNVRLSYNDIKLFVAILQSLKMQSLKLDQPKATTNKKLTRTINGITITVHVHVIIIVFICTMFMYIELISPSVLHSTCILTVFFY